MSSKTINQRKHAKRRAYERYGLKVNRDQLLEITRKIQRNDGRFLQSQSLRISLWEVYVDGKPCRVVYDKTRKTVVSFLPLEDTEEYRAAHTETRTDQDGQQSASPSPDKV